MPALRRLHPQAELSCVVGQGMGDMLRGHPDLAEVMEYDQRKDTRPLSVMAMAGRLRRRRFGLALSLQRSVKTVLLGLAAGAPQRLRQRRDHAPQADGNMPHAVDNFLRSVVPPGVDKSRCDRLLDFSVSTPSQARRAATVARTVCRPWPAPGAVQPRASAPSRQWPAAQLALLLDHLVRRRPDLQLAPIGSRHRGSTSRRPLT